MVNARCPADTREEAMSTTYARGHEWHVESRKPRGGYCIVHAERVLAVWQHYSEGLLQLRDVRVWLACHELVARRCGLTEDRTPAFGLVELQRLVGGVGGQHLRASIRRLERCDLLVFDEHNITTSPGDCPTGRLVPVPRPLLRLLARSTGKAFIATALGHLLRCVFYKRGVCSSGGWCKSSWVAETFNIGLRSVKESRAKLVELGVLQLVDADQLRLNRFGRPVLVSFTWSHESARREAESTTSSAPPGRHKKLSLRRVDHQKPVGATDLPGVRKRTKHPNLAQVSQDDLEDPWRLAALFKQARLRNWVCKCEADILCVFSAAQHALRVGTRNPPGMFYWMLSTKRWEYLSGRDEDRARKMLKKLIADRSSQSVVELNPRNQV